MLRIASLLMILATPLAAHEPGIGPNGGMRVDAGPYRVELVPEGTVVKVHITMDDESAVDTSVMTGTAILVISGKPLRAPLTPLTPGILSANTGIEVPTDVKGAIQITGPDGKTVQAKF